MKNKYNLHLLALVLIILFTASCKGRERLMFFFDDNQAILSIRFEKILEAIKNKDKNSLKAMFSEEAIEKSKQIDGDIDYLFSFFQGEAASLKQYGVSSSEEKNYGEKWKEKRCFFRIDTNEQEYLCFILECTENTANSKNVGLYTLRIIKAEDEEAQFTYWQDMKLPGVYNPNNENNNR